MNNLVYLKNDEPVCSSLQVAEKFGKRHADVMRIVAWMPLPKPYKGE